MPTTDPLITYPWSDARIGARAGVRVVEVSGSGIIDGTTAHLRTGINKGDPHPENQELICDNWDAQPIGPRLFRVVYTYSVAGGGNEDNQLKQPPEITWDNGIVSVPSDKDIDGNPIVNSALDAFDPPPNLDIIEMHLEYVRYEPAPFNIAKALRFLGAVNDDEITIAGMRFAEGTVLCTRLAPVGPYTPVENILRVGYFLSMRAKGFDLRILDQGFHGWAVDSDELHWPSEVYGRSGSAPGPQVSTPILLNGKGIPLKKENYFADSAATDWSELGGPPAGAEIDPDSGGDDEGVFLIYKQHRRENFQDMGL
jgi:hypothetical protein